MYIQFVDRVDCIEIMGREGSTSNNGDWRTIWKNWPKMRSSNYVCFGHKNSLWDKSGIVGQFWTFVQIVSLKGIIGFSRTYEQMRNVGCRRYVDPNCKATVFVLI